MSKFQCTNPTCPLCRGKTHKSGIRVLRKGKKQMHHCTECGHTFREPDLPVTIWTIEKEGVGVDG